MRGFVTDLRAKTLELTKPVSAIDQVAPLFPAQAPGVRASEPRAGLVRSSRDPSMYIILTLGPKV